MPQGLVRLPGTLKELSRQLAEFSSRVTRVEFPTEHGMLVLEFGEAKNGAAGAPCARKQSAEPAKTDGRLPENPRVRDTALMGRTPPPFEFEYGPEGKPS
jgi:hypothetical protein